jgi:hypothetical protein
MPSVKHNTDEIIADIIKLTGEPERIRALAHKLIDDLRIVCPPLTGNKKSNLEWARDLRKRVTAVKKMLRGAPDPLLAFIFAPEKFWSAWVWQNTPIENDPKVRDYLAQKPERLAQLIAELDRICAECGHIISLKPGVHGSVRYQQERAAIASRAVMEHCGKRLSCSRSSTYCKVAALFFEAASGKYDQDLLRACETVARGPLCRNRWTGNA